MNCDYVAKIQWKVHGLVPGLIEFRNVADDSKVTVITALKPFNVVKDVQSSRVIVVDLDNLPGFLRNVLYEFDLKNQDDNDVVIGVREPSSVMFLKKIFPMVVMLE